VFPDGQLDTSAIYSGSWTSKFEIADARRWRPHYAMTLRLGVARLERNRSRALAHVNEATYRVWRLYMAACALQFESGEIGITRCWRINAQPASRLAVTRRHLTASASGLLFFLKELRMRSTLLPAAAAMLSVLLSQAHAGNTDWPTYNRTLTSDRYATLEAIDNKKVTGLKSCALLIPANKSHFKPDLSNVDGALFATTERILFPLIQTTVS